MHSQLLYHPASLEQTRVIHHIGHPLGPPDFRALVIDSSLQMPAPHFKCMWERNQKTIQWAKVTKNTRKLTSSRDRSQLGGMMGGGFWANTFLGSLVISQNCSETQFLRVPPARMGPHSRQSSNKLVSAFFINNSSFPNSLSTLPFSPSGISSQINFLHSRPYLRCYF